MAFSYGFFNAKNLDRTYTAENFCDYLGSIICNGIQDNYGQCFKLTSNKLKLTIGSGKAWINEHYFLSDTPYTYDLSSYVNESLGRYLSVGICCNTGENYRKIEFEILAGTPATSPSIPRFKDTETKTYLTLCAVRIDAGITEIKVTDYRENASYCGYVRCIFGKCKVTDMMSQLAEITEQMKDYNTTILQLTNQVAELTAKVDEITGDVVSVGKCGDNINYVLCSDGKLILKGTGTMYDYASSIETSGNNSPFYDNDRIKSVVISEGITSIGEFAFSFCNNLKTATLPTSLRTIKRNGFMPHIDEYIVHQNLYGLTEITIPSKVTEIAKYAFSGTAIKSVTIPASVTTVGEGAFGECQKLETVRYSGKIIGDIMFVRCLKLKNFTITKSTKEIVGGCFNYCENLMLITYEGTISEWNAITKRTNWDGHDSQVETPLTKIQCLDGYMQYDTETKEWAVHE
ncbi:MAG: leucine-rich repeat domain-containing protein [Alistipes senegalensis]|nr:leucine-rich repeat domain-containing protein [Alistipes senegalensis]